MDDERTAHAPAEARPALPVAFVVTGWTQVYDGDTPKGPPYRSLVKQLDAADAILHELELSPTGTPMRERLYSPPGLLVEEIEWQDDGLKIRETFAHDDAARRTGTIQYDWKGRVLARSTCHYDELGRLVTEVWRDEHDGTTVSHQYDHSADGRLVHMHRGSILEWISHYDAHGRLTARRGGQTSLDAYELDVVHTHDERGALIRSIDRSADPLHSVTTYTREPVPVSGP